MDAKKLTGKLFKNTSGRASYEIYDAESDYVPRLAAMLQVHFDYAQQGATFHGLDEVYQILVKGSGSAEILIEVGWDNWSGCFVQAKSPKGDAEVVAIAAFIDEVLTKAQA